MIKTLKIIGITLIKILLFPLIGIYKLIERYFER
jgi:hypothetical protein